MKTRTKEHKFWRKLGRSIPYFLTAVLVFAFAKFGSIDKTAAGGNNLNMNAMAANNYSVSADQLSELYVVASVSSSFDLASTDSVSSNYVSASVLKEISQTSTDRIEKPGYVSVAYSKGIDTHIVVEGDTLESIASKYGLTTDQIRWSNNMKTSDLEINKSLVIPKTPGIVYTVRAGDTPDSLASRYNSSAERIIAYNDIEVGSSLSSNMQIVLPNGVLPLTERPEYVPVHNYSYYGSTSDRQNMHVVYENVVRSGTNRMVWGQCTYYSWFKREEMGRPLPANLTGDAKYWANNARRLGLTVNNTPEVGAVFQTPSGWYGHVGIVLSVHDDGSILVREMNYGYRSNVITESVIPANIVSNFNYIH